MAATVKIKRSSVAGSIPTPFDLELGELAVNTYDGRLFFKKNDGADEVLTIKPFDASAVKEDIIPDTNEAYNLGSPTRRFNELYLAGNTIDIGGATISSDGSGNITISANGAILPAGSKVATGATQAQIATVTDSVTDEDGNEVTLGLNDQVSSINVPFFTNAGGLSSSAATFTFKQNLSDSRIFKNFTLSNGSKIASGISLFSF
jgi:hypothetical protein